MNNSQRDISRVAYARRSKPVLLLAAMLLLAFLMAGCGSNTAPVGVLDPAKVMTESAKVKQFQEQLNSKGRELSENLDKEKAALTPEEFQKKQEAAYGEFLKIKQDMESQVDTQMKQSIEQVAKDKNLGVVLYKNGVAQGGVDITEEVLKKMQ
ncbi:MAG TPA: OmpH family outer membrane protein [Patescibacteria group bacterium]|nr:OmpH family outer membrane protein [Patescibacteria group bacterium]